VECLRGKPMQDLVGLNGNEVFALHRRIDGLPWEPVVGTPVLPLQPSTALRLGAAAPVPLIQGGTKDEMRAFVGVDYIEPGHPITAAQYPQILEELFGPQEAQAVLAQYPLGRTRRRVSRSQRRCRTTAACSAPALSFSQTTRPSGGGRSTPTSSPNLDQSGHQTFPMVPTTAWMCRTSSTAGFPAAPPSSLTDAQKALSAKLIGYWTTFARTGNPGQDWPGYRQSTAVSFTRGADRASRSRPRA